jgi:hypothetical protein
VRRPAGHRRPAAGAEGKAPKRYTEKLSDLIAAELVNPDTVLVPAREGVAARATVLPDGQLQVNGIAYTTPTAAAKAAAGTVAEAGWNFRKAPSGTGGLVELDELRRRLRATSGKTPPPAATAGDAGDTTAEWHGEPPASPAAEGASKPAGLPSLADIVQLHSDRFPLEIHANYRVRLRRLLQPRSRLRHEAGVSDAAVMSDTPF